MARSVASGRSWVAAGTERSLATPYADRRSPPADLSSSDPVKGVDRTIFTILIVRQSRSAIRVAVSGWCTYPVRRSISRITAFQYRASSSASTTSAMWRLSRAASHAPCGPCMVTRTVASRRISFDGRNRASSAISMPLNRIGLRPPGSSAALPERTDGVGTRGSASISPNGSDHMDCAQAMLVGL